MYGLCGTFAMKIWLAGWFSASFSVMTVIVTHRFASIPSSLFLIQRVRDVWYMQLIILVVQGRSHLEVFFWGMHLRFIDWLRVVLEKLQLSSTVGCKCLQGGMFLWIPQWHASALQISSTDKQSSQISPFFWRISPNYLIQHRDRLFECVLQVEIMSRLAIKV